MQVTHGSYPNLLKIQVVSVLLLALAVLTRICSLIDRFPHALGVVGAEGPFRRMGTQNGPWPACFAPLAIYGPRTLLDPAPSPHGAAQVPQRPQGPEPFCPRCLHFLQSPCARRPILVSSHLPATRRNRQAFVAIEGIERRFNLSTKGLMSPS